MILFSTAGVAAPPVFTSPHLEPSGGGSRPAAGNRIAIKEVLIGRSPDGSTGAGSHKGMNPAPAYHSPGSRTGSARMRQTSFAAGPHCPAPRQVMGR